ncbi:MAG: ATP-binding cassette domain-containing protein [Thermoproteota archaeon]
MSYELPPRRRIEDLSLPGVSGAPLRVLNLGLKKGGHTILSNLNFVLEPSEILGVISNRTEHVEQLFKLLLGVEKPSLGEIVYFNNPRIGGKELRKRIGFYSFSMNLIDSLSVAENFLLVASMHGLSGKNMLNKVNELLSLFESTELSRVKWSRLPLAVKRKLCFASTLMHDPNIILLYDPFRGVPFNTASFMRNFLRTLTDLGKSIIVFSTVPILLDGLCDRIMVLHNGQQVALDHVESFVTGMSGPGMLSVHVSNFSIEDNIDALEKMSLSWYATGEKEAVIELDNVPEKIGLLIRLLVKKGAVVERVISSRQHLLESASRLMEG